MRRRPYPPSLTRCHGRRRSRGSRWSSRLLPPHSPEPNPPRRHCRTSTVGRCRQGRLALSGVFTPAGGSPGESPPRLFGERATPTPFRCGRTFPKKSDMSGVSSARGPIRARGAGAKWQSVSTRWRRRSTYVTFGQHNAKILQASVKFSLFFATCAGGVPGDQHPQRRTGQGSRTGPANRPRGPHRSARPPESGHPESASCERGAPAGAEHVARRRPRPPLPLSFQPRDRGTR